MPYLKTPEDEGTNHGATGGRAFQAGRAPCAECLLQEHTCSGQGADRRYLREGGEKVRDKFIEAATVWGWLCNWPRGCGIEGAWLCLKWRGYCVNSTETLKR